jgi:hypothetical protein
VSERIPPLGVASAGGALWGVAGYLVLWGHTPFFPDRNFVVSPLGTFLLLPVRLVLWSIRLVEGIAGRNFEFAGNNWWIGVVAGLVGAAIVSVTFLLIRGVLRSRGGNVRAA